MHFCYWQKLLPTFHFSTINSSTYIVNPTCLEYFINRIKILTPTHQYIASNTNPYNMKWSCKKGAVRGNTMVKFFCVYLVSICIWRWCLILKHTAQYYHIHNSLPLDPILIYMSEVHILAPYFLGNDMQEKTLLLGSSSKFATSIIF